MVKVPLGVMPPTAAAPATMMDVLDVKPWLTWATVTTAEPLVTLRGLEPKRVGGPKGVMSLTDPPL